ncbi:hypothetical protein DL96DRAFT_344811 [Flagelloscypha sp. PMI_526]|nr:hypothetical protein DL96DRAFT_344811 [Flagelloscypha sp. PMI_526]
MTAANRSKPVALRAYRGRGSSVQCTLLEALLATLSDGQVLPPISVGVGISERLVATTHRYCNPMETLFEEIPAIFNSRFISAIVSIGSGRPTAVPLHGEEDFAIDVLGRSRACHTLSEHAASEFSDNPSFFLRFDVKGFELSKTIEPGDLISHTRGYLAGDEIRRLLDTLIRLLTHRPSHLEARSLTNFKSGVVDKMGDISVHTIKDSNNIERHTTSSSTARTSPIADSIHPASDTPKAQTVQPDALQASLPQAPNAQDSGDITCYLQRNPGPEPPQIKDQFDPRAFNVVDLLRTAHDSPAHKQKTTSVDIPSAPIIQVSREGPSPHPSHKISPSAHLGRVELQKRLDQIIRCEGCLAANQMCKQIVDTALSIGNEDDTKRRWTIFHAIMSIAEPSSANCVSRLLDMDVHLVTAVVQSLYPVLITDDMDGRIHVSHQYFHNFLVSSSEGTFPFHPPSIHLILAQSCVREMATSLQFNICNLKSSFTPDMDLKPTLAEHTAKHIGETLSYASKNWWFHITRCDVAGKLSILPTIEPMLQEKGIFWIEVMSLLDEIEGCITILEELSSSSAILLVLPSINLLASEAKKMASFFRRMPEKTTSQLYLSFLAFSEVISDLDCWKTQFPCISRAINHQGHGAQEPAHSDGHTDSVRSVAFSPNGKKIVSGSQDRTVCIWDAESGQMLQQLNGHGGYVLSVAFSSDGARIVSGSSDNNIGIWDVESGEHLRWLRGYSHGVYSAAFSPDGKYIVSGSDDGTVRIWDAESGQMRQQLNGHSGYVHSVAFSSDGARIVSGCKDGSIRIWDAKIGTLLRGLFGHKRHVYSASFSPDGTRIVSGSRDQSIRIWDSESGKELRQINGHTDQVNSVAFSHNGKHIVSGSQDQMVCIWEAESGRRLWQLKGFSGSVHSVAFSPDGKRFISGSQDKTIRIWDAESCQGYQQLNRHSNDIRTVQFSLQVSGATSTGYRHAPDFSTDPKTSEKKPVPAVQGVTTSLISNSSNSPHVSSVHLPVRSEFSPTSQPPIELPDSPHLLHTIVLSPTSSSLHCRDDGWLVTSYEETGVELKIIWIPPALKPFDPQALLVIARAGSKRIDLSGCVFGEGWDRCYAGRTYDYA